MNLKVPYYVMKDFKTKPKTELIAVDISRVIIV